MLKISFLCVLLSTILTAVHARPVSYPGGWTVMQKNDAVRHTFHMHYSPTVNQSVGYLFEQNRYGSELLFNGLQYNRLLHRRNRKASQGNLYFKSALGVDLKNGNETAHGGFLGMAADWEDRRWFTSYENRLDFGPLRQASLSHMARVGVAPYIGDYGDIHTWLMLQAFHSKDMTTHSAILRLFKGPYLAEFGITTDNTFTTNLIIRF